MYTLSHKYDVFIQHFISKSWHVMYTPFIPTLINTTRNLISINIIIIQSIQYSVKYPKFAQHLMAIPKGAIPKEQECQYVHCKLLSRTAHIFENAFQTDFHKKKKNKKK